MAKAWPQVAPDWKAPCFYILMVVAFGSSGKYNSKTLITSTYKVIYIYLYNSMTLQV